jgi:hypothetical protein
MEKNKELNIKKEITENQKLDYYDEYDWISACIANRCINISDINRPYNENY